MEEKRIGVYVCWCGTNIAGMVDVEAVSREIGKLPNVVVSKEYKYICSDPGQDMIIKDIRENNLNRVVVAACSPRMHEPTFRKTLANAGLNSYMFEMANIREQDSWVHEDKEEATIKAKALIAAAVNRIKYHEPLANRTVDINSATLIIGGGIAGITAALEIADAGKKVFLIEKTDRLGGIVAETDSTFPFFTDTRQLLLPLISRIKNHSFIDVFYEAEIKQVSGFIGNFETTVYGSGGKETNLKFGNIIVATGLKPLDPSGIEQYGYGKFPDVYTSFEFEKILKKGNIVTKTMQEPKHIAIIHCVGSRNQNYHEYCSSTCCMTALKYANQIRSELPNAHIFDIYADMRAFGKDCEELYTLSSFRKIKFFMFDQQDELPKIIKSERKNCEMIIELEEKLTGKSIAIPADMVILMVGVEAQENARDIAHAVGISTCKNSFYIERHPKLDPVATTTDGVYIVGTCQGPKNIPDTISQARAAAARILGVIAQGKVLVEVTTASVNENICCGCQTCIKVCPYTAISFDAEKKVSVVNETLCKGCGTCGSACPTGAIKCSRFTDKQILAQIEGLLSMSFS